jgi:hypothetical protein
MKNKILILIAFICTLSSCGDFETTNVDPRQVKEAPTRTLLTFALQQVPFITFNSPTRQLTGYDTNFMNFYVQYLSEGPYPGASLYSTRNLNWTSWYTGPLYNLQTIINENTAGSTLADPGANGSKNNQLAVARILKAYFFWYLTDLYGDIPYSTALKGNQVLQPSFDTQESIYTDLFKELTEAQALINSSETAVTGDILLNGNMLSWKKFANTIRLYMSLRLIKKDAAKAKAEFNAALTAGVLGEGENIEFSFIGGDPNNLNPWYKTYVNDNRNDVAVSSTIGRYMLTNTDPRIKVYAETFNGEVRPLPYGGGSAVNIPGAYSRLGARMQAAGAIAPIFTYAQLLFVKAEAAQRGFITEDAKALYEAGIKASWQYWGVYETTAFADYLADTDIAYTAATGLEKIITQKWAHQYLNGFEGWADWKRTGFPAFTPASGTTQGGGIPRRMGYPSSTRALNEENYDAVVARQGADDNYTRMYWDVK